MADHTICSNAVNTVLLAMQQTSLTYHPLLAVISANGVLSHALRDHQLALTPLYRWMLRNLYDDDRAMEAALAAARPLGILYGRET